MAKKNIKRNIKSDFKKKFISKEVLQSSSESETDDEDVPRNFVQGIINTSISTRGKLIINPHLKVVQKKMDNHSTPSKKQSTPSPRRAPVAIEVSDSSSDNSEDEFGDSEVEHVFAKNEESRFVAKPSNDGIPNLNFELASNLVTRQLLSENKIMWKAKFIECFASDAAAKLPASATNEKIAARNISII